MAVQELIKVFDAAVANANQDYIENRIQPIGSLGLTVRATGGSVGATVKIYGYDAFGVKVEIHSDALTASGTSATVVSVNAFKKINVAIESWTAGTLYVGLNLIDYNN